MTVNEKRMMIESLNLAHGEYISRIDDLLSQFFNEEKQIYEIPSVQLKYPIFFDNLVAPIIGIKVGEADQFILRTEDVNDVLQVFSDKKTKITTNKEEKNGNI